MIIKNTHKYRYIDIKENVHITNKLLYLYLYINSIYIIIHNESSKYLSRVYLIIGKLKNIVIEKK